jgi:hypothetical protein
MAPPLLIGMPINIDKTIYDIKKKELFVLDTKSVYDIDILHNFLVP